jgi:hypothetical protein
MRDHYDRDAGAPQRLALEDGELMAEGDNLRLEFESGPHGGPEGGPQSDEQRVPTGRERYQPPTLICNDDKRFRISGRGCNSGVRDSVQVGIASTRARAVRDASRTPRRRSS